MQKLCALEELNEYTRDLREMYCYYLWKKGYHKTIYGLITAEDVAEIEQKYGLLKTISDFDFGLLEGRIYLTLILRSFYDADMDGGHIAWLNHLISVQLDKIWHFIFGSAKRKPGLIKSLSFDFEQELACKLRNEEAIQTYQGEIDNWRFTPSEFGELCGFVDAAYWAIGSEWTFLEEDFDVPIDWGGFYGYLNKRASKLKRRGIRSRSVVFQVFLGIEADGEPDGNGVPNLRGAKLTPLPVGDGSTETGEPRLTPAGGQE